MGRRALTDTRKRVCVYIDEALLARFTFLNFDPARGGAAYGALSDFINEALRKHVVIGEVKLPEED